MIRMDPKICMKLEIVSWILAVGGLMILAAIYLGADVGETNLMTDNGAICALLTLGGPLFAYIINSIALRKETAYENDWYYKRWRIDSLIYLYMMLMACISFAMLIDSAYATSSREAFQGAMALILILALVWIVFLAINCVCFLFAVREHNNTAPVKGDDFNKGLQVILRQIDEMNGLVAPKEKGIKIKFGKKSDRKGTDGTLPTDETNVVVTPKEDSKKRFEKRDKKEAEANSQDDWLDGIGTSKDERPKKGFRKRDKKGGEEDGQN